MGEGESPEGQSPGRERGTSHKGTRLFLKLLSAANSLRKLDQGQKIEGLSPGSQTHRAHYMSFVPLATGHQKDKGMTDGQATQRRGRSESAPFSEWLACQHSTLSCFTSEVTPVGQPQPCCAHRTSQGPGEPSLQA